MSAGVGHSYSVYIPSVGQYSPMNRLVINRTVSAATERNNCTASVATERNNRTVSVATERNNRTVSVATERHNCTDSVATVKTIVQ